MLHMLCVGLGTASHSAPWLCGSDHVPAAAETQPALWNGLLEAVLGCLKNHKPPQGRWTCWVLVGAWVEATGQTKDGAKWHGLRQEEKLGASRWGGESCEELVCGQKPPGMQNLLITGKEKL